MKLKISPYKLLLILPFLMLAASCGNGTNNTLTRPETEQTNEQTSQANSNIATDDSGVIAGAEIIQLPTKTIKVNDLNVEVELATTDIDMERGLSGRTQLDDNKGMLFDFTNSELKKPGIWMKDMLISIDIIWINNAGKIVGIEANAPLPPEDKDLPVYYPPSEISHVLEVPAGWAAKNNITVDSTVSF